MSGITDCITSNQLNDFVNIIFKEMHNRLVRGIFFFVMGFQHLDFIFPSPFSLKCLVSYLTKCLILYHYGLDFKLEIVIAVVFQVSMASCKKHRKTDDLGFSPLLLRTLELVTIAPVKKYMKQVQEKVCEDWLCEMDFLLC